jgi:hypothetical protein
MATTSFAVRKALCSSSATPCSGAYRLALVSLLLLGVTQLTSADQLGVDLLASSIASVSAVPAAPIDEIIVTGKQAGRDSLQSGPIHEDPLFVQVREDFEMRHELEKALDRRRLTTGAEVEPLSIRLGFDADASALEALGKQHLELPMDLVRPATVISLTF